MCDGGVDKSGEGVEERKEELGFLAHAFVQETWIEVADCPDERDKAKIESGVPEGRVLRRQVFDDLFGELAQFIELALVKVGSRIG